MKHLVAIVSLVVLMLGCTRAGHGAGHPGRSPGTFPELKAAMHPSYAAVTLERLLRHRSGLG